MDVEVQRQKNVVVYFVSGNKPWNLVNQQDNSGRTRTVSSRCFSPRSAFRTSSRMYISCQNEEGHAVAVNVQAHIRTRRNIPFLVRVVRCVSEIACTRHEALPWQWWQRFGAAGTLWHTRSVSSQWTPQRSAFRSVSSVHVIAKSPFAHAENFHS